MKAQYVGDIGDVGKVLLLKYLAEVGFKIGVNWVLTKNDESGDGRHRNYVGYRGIDCLCCIDRKVIEGIIPIANKNERTIHDLENLIRKFLKNPVFYSEYFDEDLPRNVRNDEAFKLLTPDVADLVFFDPDNGIDARRGASPKHVYLPELRRYWQRGQSLLIYHHLPQHNFAEDAIKQLTLQLEDFPTAQVKAFHFRRGTGRVYMLCLQPGHQDRVCDPVTVKAFAPMLMTKSGWAKTRRITGKACSEDHQWQKAIPAAPRP